MTTAAGHARRERRIEAARRAYQKRFGEDTPVVSRNLYSPHFSDLLMAAVEAGKPLTAEVVAEGLGVPRRGRWSGS